jgi:hypothetical protein
MNLCSHPSVVTSEFHHIQSFPFFRLRLKRFFSKKTGNTQYPFLIAFTAQQLIAPLSWVRRSISEVKFLATSAMVGFVFCVNRLHIPEIPVRRIPSHRRLGRLRVPEDGRHVQNAALSSSCIKAASTLPAAAMPSSVTFAQFLGSNVVVPSGRKIDCNHVSVRIAPLLHRHFFPLLTTFI